MGTTVEASMQRPTASRPGGRSARVRDDVIAATLHELAARGYRELTVDAVADRAGVNKTTIYRRWSDLDGLLADVLTETGITRAPIPDTGRLDSDLRLLAIGIARAVGDPVIGELLRGLTAGQARGAASTGVLRDFLQARRRLATPIIEQAVARGELVPDTDGFALLKSLVAPFFLHLLITGEPVDEALATRNAAATYAAAVAGAFTPIA
jgi:AcrR family transcriptional regulator